MTDATFESLLHGAAVQLREERMAEAAPRHRRGIRFSRLLLVAVLTCVLSAAAALAANPLFVYRAAYRNADWTEVTLSFSASAASAATDFCSLAWVPSAFAECSLTPIRAEDGVYSLTLKNGEQTLSVYQSPSDKFLLYGRSDDLTALRAGLDFMTELPIENGTAYFSIADGRRLDALLLHEGTAVFISGNIDQWSFLKFVRNVEF